MKKIKTLIKKKFLFKEPTTKSPAAKKGGRGRKPAGK